MRKVLELISNILLDTLYILISDYVGIQYLNQVRIVYILEFYLARILLLLLIGKMISSAQAFFLMLCLITELEQFPINRFHCSTHLTTLLFLLKYPQYIFSKLKEKLCSRVLYNSEKAVLWSWQFDNASVTQSSRGKKSLSDSYLIFTSRLDNVANFYYLLHPTPFSEETKS